MKFEELRELDIVELANHLDLPIKKSGENYSCKCPFHSDKTPSFFIFPTTNTYKCFGRCNQDGRSTLDLVMNINQCSLIEAADYLRFDYGDEERVKVLIIKKKEKPKPITYATIDHWYNLLLITNRWQFFTERGFTKETIKKVGFGWNGERYVIPVWQGKPRESKCLGLRLRSSEISGGSKYMSSKGSITNIMYGLQESKMLHLPFVSGQAGELDAQLALQSKFPSVSTVGGMKNTKNYVKGWPSLWFPTVKYWLSIFDYKETIEGSKLAMQWEKVKGRGTSFVIHWKDSSCDDFTEFMKKYNMRDFIDLLVRQIHVKEMTNYLNQWLVNYEKLGILV